MKKNKLKFKLKFVTSPKLFYKIPRFVKYFSRRFKVKKTIAKKLVVETNAKSFWNDNFNIVIPETISSSIYSNGYFEADLTGIIINLLEENQTFIDVGAHIGYFSKLASHIVGKNGKVYSFEPTPSTYSLLNKNVRTSNNITVINKAAFSSEKEIDFNDYGVINSAMNSFKNTGIYLGENVKKESIKVKTTTIDHFCKINNIEPNFIKIDAENAEYEILLGMNEVLKKHKPILSLEFGDFNIEHVPKGKEVINFLENFNYKAYDILSNKLKLHKTQEKYNYCNLIFINNDKTII